MSDALFWSLIGFTTLVSLVLMIVVYTAARERRFRRTPAQRKSDREVIARYRALRSDTERMAGMQ